MNIPYIHIQYYTVMGEVLFPILERLTNWFNWLTVPKLEKYCPHNFTVLCLCPLLTPKNIINSHTYTHSKQLLEYIPGVPWQWWMCRRDMQMSWNHGWTVFRQILSRMPCEFIYAISIFGKLENGTVHVLIRHVLDNVQHLNHVFNAWCLALDLSK